MIFCVAADTCEVEEVGDISGNSKYNLISTRPCMVQYLIAIVKGETNSNLHMYWHGSKIEKSKIRLHDKFWAIPIIA